MSTIPSTLPSYLTNYLTGAGTGAATGTATGAAGPASSAADGPTGAGGAAGTADSAATITLSDEAKAYLAATGATGTTGAPAATPARTARAWLDEQYTKLAITEPTPKDKPALDLAPLKRAELAAIVANADTSFTEAEQKAAEGELAKRFDAAMTPHMAIARKSANYAALYQTAADYLEQAGADERATKAWQDDRRAIADGLTAAKASKGQAPETDPAKDPIRALLDRRAATATSAGASAGAVAANARAMLDDQANAAADAGTRLVFDARQDGQRVDFSKFSSRALAAIALNADDTFSGEEALAAKTALNTRTRDTMLGVLNPESGSGADMNLGLLGTYENMSDEEKAVLGVTDAVTDRLIQNYQSLQSLQNAFAGAGSGMFGLSAAMLAAYNANQSRADDYAGLGLSGLL